MPAGIEDSVSLRGYGKSEFLQDAQKCPDARRTKSRGLRRT
jgi:hypothetical protein